MASPLDQIARAIRSGTKGKLRSGTLYRRGTASGVDLHGDAVRTVASSFPFEGLVSGYDDAYRKAAGIPETDAKALIIAGSTTATPTKDDVVLVEGEYWQLRQMKRDPASATYGGRCFMVDKPGWV